ncbi:MAG TPA: glycoside hydrolase family 43 protein, partial [Sunxiuqinia sp.]|nr:glycoside hydrolase family 43 protein [Sunxiuqinia sp.]
NWKNEGTALTVSNQPGADIENGCVIERPKVIYNKMTGKFVMWFHLELKGQGYNAARTGLAISEQVTGPYAFIKSLRPNKEEWPVDYPEALKTKSYPTDLEWWKPKWYQAIKEGMFLERDFESGQMSRDMTLFVDDDGKAYHIHASEDNLTIHISQLTDDYQSFSGKYIRVAPAGHNEAPALFKKDGIYYLTTSGCTGWAPNAARMFNASSIWGPWEALGNPCVGDDADLTFHSQSTFVLPVQGKKDAFIFMADRWKPKNPNDGRYIWLPIQFENGKPVIRWKNEWDLSVFN